MTQDTRWTYAGVGAFELLCQIRARPGGGVRSFELPTHIRTPGLEGAIALPQLLAQCFGTKE